jgi:dipeptidyl aminopeptidase/acylaminoacyl peptidase
MAVTNGADRRIILVNADTLKIGSGLVAGVDAQPAVHLEQDHQDQARELSPDGATWSDPLPDWATEELIYDDASHKLIGGYKLIEDDGVYTFVDAALQARWDAIKRAYPGAIVTLQSMSEDLTRFVVKVESPVDPPAFALVDVKTRHATWVAKEYEGLKAADMNPVKPVAFKAKDGLDLTGYLTPPVGRDAKAPPLVVFPHGGPHSRDEPGFGWWAQAMASRGYAVLQVNFRGSSGLGWDFQAKGFGEFGRKMQTDLSDGVRYLAAQGVIDPKRVCIVGASYGGYAALTGATLDTGVYRCAASIAGISDPRKMLTWENSRDPDGASDNTRFWTRYMGDASTLDQIAPITHIDRVTIPILLVHGKDDTVVAYQQSQMMADALTKAGKPYEFVTLKAEDHWLSRGATRLEMLQAVVAFLEKHNPPG